jgi:hypothetical protein
MAMGWVLDSEIPDQYIDPFMPPSRAGIEEISYSHSFLAQCRRRAWTWLSVDTDADIVQPLLPHHSVHLDCRMKIRMDAGYGRIRYPPPGTIYLNRDKGKY